VTTRSFHEDSRKASVFKGIWFKPGIFAAVQHLNELTPHPLALSLRWLAHHSALDAASGDGIILGASRPEQLDAALDALGGGPLTEEEVKGFERMWELVGDDAPEVSH
jgi:aflatoxin B1 aldehyde reductase